VSVIEGTTASIHADSQGIEIGQKEESRLNVPTTKPNKNNKLQERSAIWPFVSDFSKKPYCPDCFPFLMR
jgi:hypothetical protein